MAVILKFKNRYVRIRICNAHVTLIKFTTLLNERLKLYLSNKTEKVNGKTGQFKTKCKSDRVIALKRQIISFW